MTNARPASPEAGIRVLGAPEPVASASPPARPAQAPGPAPPPTLAGPLLFLRYAYMPNRLGYCGAEDNQALLDYGLAGQVDGGLLELERQFEGAYPYLQLIARANDIADPLDRRVVDAYWIGNRLLDRVDMGDLQASIGERFRERTRPAEWPWLAAKAGGGARPHHSFHVLEIYPRIGLMRSGAADHVLQTLEQCRIRWGRVRAVMGPELLVSVEPLVLRQGKLALGEPVLEQARRWVDGRGFVDAAREGDWVAIHWGWACDLLSEQRRASLERYTRWHLHLCNETL